MDQGHPAVSRSLRSVPGSCPTSGHICVPTLPGQLLGIKLPKLRITHDEVHQAAVLGPGRIGLTLTAGITGPQGTHGRGSPAGFGHAFQHAMTLAWCEGVVDHGLGASVRPAALRADVAGAARG